MATVIDLAPQSARAARAAKASASRHDGRSRQARHRRRHPGPTTGQRSRGPDLGFPCCIFASRIPL
ncbi:hypothetical protein [Paraburkholderia sp.]|uniref:hypothetical protein n=1 Tax=Paraburkholderia sp. TaxID=1926495 RepID=UPI0025EA13A2|nr:hypothetical protein [Paraburkholderia sp.]